MSENGVAVRASARHRRQALAVEALKSKIAYRNRFHRAFNRAERALTDHDLPRLRLAAQPEARLVTLPMAVFAPMLETDLSEGRVA